MRARAYINPFDPTSGTPIRKCNLRAVFAKRLLAACLAACTLLMATSEYIASRQQATPQTAAFGNYTSQQVLARSQEAIVTLMAGATRGDVELFRTTSYTASGQETHVWIVDCEDPTSGKNVSLRWDADTGELLRAAQWKNGEIALPYDAPSSRNEAIALAWDWFHALDRRDSHEECHVAATHKLSQARWEVTIKAGGSTARLVVTTATGKLVQMVCTHRSETI